jgi:hypothetical protein
VLAYFFHPCALTSYLFSSTKDKDEIKIIDSFYRYQLEMKCQKITLDHKGTIIMNRLMQCFLINPLSSNASYFILLLSLTPDNFTRQGESLAL